MMLVDTIAAARWRQDRIWGIQKTAFDQDVASGNDKASGDAGAQTPPQRILQALRGSADNVRAHELLLRYEIALDRQLSRALLRLQQMQAKRNGKEKAAPEERTQQSAETKRPPSTALGPKVAQANRTTTLQTPPSEISSKVAEKPLQSTRRARLFSLPPGFCLAPQTKSRPQKVEPRPYMFLFPHLSLFSRCGAGRQSCSVAIRGDVFVSCEKFAHGTDILSSR